MTESDLVTSRALKAVWESCTWSRGLERGKRVAFCTSWRSLCQSRKAAKGEVMVKDTREGRARSRRGGGCALGASGGMWGGVSGTWRE